MSGSPDDETTGADTPSAEDADASDARDIGPDVGDRQQSEPPRQLNAALVATLVAIPVMVLAGFITFAALGSDDNDATPIDSYTATAESNSPDCAKLFTAVPGTFPGFDTKQIAGDQVTWPATDGGDPVTLRCGITRPSEFSPSSSLQVVHPVQWFLTDTVDGVGQAFVSVDHRPYVALWIPIAAGNAPITDVSAAIDQTLPRAPLDFG